MDIPIELPVIYSIPILIPGFLLKISVVNNSSLLNYLRNGSMKSQSNCFVGIIPKTDYGKVGNVMGTVGLVQSIITLDSNPEELFLLVQGVCRFKLDVTVTEKPLKMNKIITIEDFKNLSGNKNKIKELCAEFEKVLNDYLTYNELMLLNPLANAHIKNHFKEIPLHQFVDYCLKYILHLSPADTYDVLRATNLNNLLKCVMSLLKRETIKANKYTTYEQTGLVVAPPRINKTYILKKRQSPELQKIYIAIKNSNMPKPIYDSILLEFNKLQEMNPYITDYSISIQYLSYVVNLPWDISTKETLDLKKAKSVLELNHYGIDKVKKRIVEFIAAKILNPERQGPILCFIGPPGVGKTTIAKAIANALNRTFKRISLGGINTYAHIKGHRKTYAGAMPGCIIQAINQAQTNNPIILLDEIDKMQSGSHGDPAAALLEVLDPEQNNSFVDSYVNLPFDLSQVMFISTANDKSNIPLTLLDRMETIYLDSYTLEEKIQIAEKYLIPKILKDHKLNEVQITIPQLTIKSIIQNYTCEAGVRELQRRFEAIYGFISVEIVENKDKNKNYIISPDYLKHILGNGIYYTKNTVLEECRDRVGVAIGLGWTPVGGRILMVETSRLYSSNENNSLVLTGLVGQSLKESVEIALNWIQSFSNKNELDNNFCVHVHFPAGTFRKDGPSAGITIACALVSLIWNIPLISMIAMTGEISLQGYVLPVGGVKEKLLAAYNSGIKTIIIPEFNFKDVDSLPKGVKEELNIIPVKHLKEVLEIVIPGGIKFLQNPLRSKI